MSSAPVVHPYLDTMSKLLVATNANQVLNNFFLDASATQWEDMSAALVAIMADASAALIPSPRILVTLSDGTVAYDTGKPTSNNFVKFVLKQVNENHNSRVAILTALLSTSGMGTEQKYSTSTRKTESYLAIRIGRTPQESVGVIRFSFQASA